MAQDIDFWFTFGSPAGYLASHRIDEIAVRHGRKARWRPFNIRSVLAQEGIKPNILYERKGRYTRHDWERTARLRGIPFRLPDPFLRPTLPAMTVFYWVADELGEGPAKAFAQAVMRAYFVDNAEIDEPDALALIAEGCGIDGDKARMAIEDRTYRERLDAATTEASRIGVWGSPFVIVDGEPFWGEDRLDQVDLWLTRGGW
jgi:2-hydroxychromene-2-carboxylate isomerase